MKIRAQKGFSLAEVLISLTVVSIMLAVAAPVITKQHVGDETWKWTQGVTAKNGVSYDGNSVVIGKATVPTISELEDFDSDGYTYFNYYPREDAHDFAYNSDFLRDASNGLFMDINKTKLLSKLSIVKPMAKQIATAVNSARNPFPDSHISFYNVVDGQTEYAGRLVADARNIGLGIGSLARRTLYPQTNLSFDYYYNTAIGHYTLSNLPTTYGNVALGYAALEHPTNINIGNTGIGYNVYTSGNYLTSIMNDIHDNVRIGTKSLIIGNYLQDDDGETNKETNFNTQNILIGNNAGLGHYTFNTSNGNRLAIGNVDLSSTAQDDAKVELIQGSLLHKDSTVEKDIVYKKLVVNGDFVVKNAKGSKTLFKVDSTGQTIGYDQDRDASIRKFDNVSGPARCEGAEICIGKFNVPYADCGFLTPKSTSIDAYDIYIPTMAVGVYHSTLKKIPYLGAALLYLDRYKDTKGSVIGLLEKRENIFNSTFGFSSTGIELIDFIGALFGLSDARLKNVYGDSTIGLNEINALKVKNYTYKVDKTKTPHVGVIAQELQKVFPNSVVVGADGYLSIKQEEMFYGLVKSIQELSSRNQKIFDKLALSEEKIEHTIKQNKLIEQENKLLEKQNKEFAKRIAKLKKKKT